MEEIVIIILQVLLEIFINVFVCLPFEWPLSRRETPECEKLTGLCFLFFWIGCGVAWLSLVFFKYTFISVPVMRLFNLILSPIAAAYISHWIAGWYAKVNANILPRNHFWQTFWFTLGFVLIRFVYVSRGYAT